MNPELVSHVFGSLQSLEKSLDTIKELSRLHKSESADIIALIPKQEEILIDMRRTANLLQLQIAKEDWDTAVRSLKVFYGLNHLIRPDIMSAFGILARRQARTAASKVERPNIKEVVYH